MFLGVKEMIIKTIEIPSHLSQNGYYQENKQQQMFVWMWREKEPL
jgi:hypothetical protein